MKSINPNYFLVIFCIFFAISLSAQDRLRLKSGEIYEGEIVFMSKSFIKLKTKYGLLKIPRNKVKQDFIFFKGITIESGNGHEGAEVVLPTEVETVVKEEKIEDKYIEISISGGGYYGGIDKVIKDYITVKNDGSIIKEYESESQGHTVTKSQVPREQLEKFIDYVSQKGFFEFAQVYDCETDQCKYRQVKKPTPIPLRISMTYGLQKNVVQVGIYDFNPSSRHYIELPEELEFIIMRTMDFVH